MISKEMYDKEIKNILNQLVSVYKPVKIILFGSLAENAISESSDIDLLIVKEAVPRTGVERIRELDALISYDIATDFIVLTPEELESRLSVNDPFISAILKKGITLYERAA